jgi:hypothetical protein
LIIRQRRHEPALGRQKHACAQTRFCGQHRAHLRSVHGAEHGVDGGGVEIAAGIGDGLVEQGQAVAQAAVGGAGQQRDGTGLGRDGLGLEDAADLAAAVDAVQRRRRPRAARPG